MAYARQVLRFGHPVIISFGHDMNGNWYGWGWTHASPRLFVRAWQHVVTVFRKVGADNVTCLWTVNNIAPGEPPVRDWRPGQVAGPSQKIPDLFAGVRQSGLLGFVWFDVAQHAGLYHQDWRLEGQRAASAVFRRAVRTYGE